MNCKYCNAPMEEGQELCPVCGKNVTEETAEVNENAFTCECVEGELPEEKEAAPAPQKKSGVLGWIIAAVLILVIAAGALFAYDALKNGVVPTEDITVQGGGNYTAPEAELTEEQQLAVVAFAEKNGTVRRVKEKLGMTGKFSKGLTNDRLAVYYWDGFYNFYNTYGYYAMMMGLDPATMDTTEYQAGQTWQEYFLSQALNIYRSQVAVTAQAKAEGYVLSEELETELAETEKSLREMEDVDEQLRMVYGAGVSLEEHLEYLRGQYYYSGYLTDYEENLTFTDEELSAYYDENAESYQANGIVKSEEGAQAEDSLTQAEAVYAQWQAGEATEESFAALATEHTTDPGSQSTGGLYENVYEGQMVPAFNDWCFDAARQPGDTGIVETDYGHHVMYFVSKNEDGTVNVRHILLQSVNPDAWKETVAADYKSHKLTEFISETAKSYVMDLDLSKVALALPGQITQTPGASETPTTETTDVAP